VQDVSSVDALSSTDEEHTDGVHQHDERQEQMSKRARAMASWGKPGAFPVAPPDLSELEQHLVDF
jgi:hypothetical protein